ncbi:uncharacterized protein CPUR_01354 [Claviceps purpurea 20.1]|uniref:Uncharacterized protein n=1 Tax=Claviceps purpurea (strain 20.1) TaxID=1111077 RepID=M1W2S2_CLAP2|nr:hypothetical protein E4U12_001045 [Claviceps purpurea]CCE27880.1 uncharacterized protein CPUR_01354 [Claviceps purpurea 20.1]
MELTISKRRTSCAAPAWYTNGRYSTPKHTTKQCTPDSRDVAAAPLVNTSEPRRRPRVRCSLRNIERMLHQLLRGPGTGTHPSWSLSRIPDGNKREAYLRRPMTFSNPTRNHSTDLLPSLPQETTNRRNTPRGPSAEESREAEEEEDKTSSGAHTSPSTP